MLGKLLWFNEAKDCGLISTEDGERVAVPGRGFAGGVRPQGRCAGVAVSFSVTDGEGGPEADEVVLVTDATPPRARSRRGSHR